MRTTSFLILFVIVTFPNITIGQKDYTFCWGSFSLKLFDGGFAKQIQYGTGGMVLKTVNGEWTAYGSPNDIPGQTIKITYELSSQEFSYTLIRDGYGNPARLVDGEGRNYTLCKSENSSNGTNMEDAGLQERLKEWEEIRAYNDASTNAYAQAFAKEIDELYVMAQNPEKRSDIPQYFESIQNRVEYRNVFSLFSQNTVDKYNQLQELTEVIQKEKIEVEKEKTKPDYYKLHPGFLKDYTNTNGNMIKFPESCNEIYYYSEKGVNKVTEPLFKGYIKDGIIYNLNKIEIARINETNDYYYHIDIISQDGKFNQVNLWKQCNGGVNELNFPGYSVYLAHEDNSGEIDKTEQKYYVKQGNNVCAILAMVQLYIKYNVIQPQENASSFTTRTSNLDKYTGTFKSQHPSLDRIEINEANDSLELKLFTTSSCSVYKSVRLQSDSIYFADRETIQNMKDFAKEGDVRYNYLIIFSSDSPNYNSLILRKPLGQLIRASKEN